MRTFSDTAWDIASRYSDVLASETRDLAAAIDAIAPKWQPIETAPKDGSRFVARGVRHGDLGYTEDEVTEMFMRSSRSGPRVDQPTGRYFCGFSPTHWMRMPPPESENESE